VLACAANDKPVSHCALFSSSSGQWVVLPMGRLVGGDTASRHTRCLAMLIRGSDIPPGTRAASVPSPDMSAEGTTVMPGAGHPRDRVLVGQPSPSAYGTVPPGTKGTRKYLRTACYSGGRATPAEPAGVARRPVLTLTSIALNPASDLYSPKRRR
jgi:hypothetical protein